MTKPVIMVVDDEIGTLTLLGIMLEHRGYQVRKAKSAQSGFDILDEMTPDLFILDIMMPGMDGIEFLKKVREREACKAVPIIMATARMDGETRKRAIEAGANEYITKPIKNDALLSLVQKYIYKT